MLSKVTADGPSQRQEADSYGRGIDRIQDPPAKTAGNRVKVSVQGSAFRVQGSGFRVV